jgi:predicted RNA-binding protein with PIN domain
LPPALWDDSPEAAEHLMRLPGVVLLVDGYNVSNAGWPGTPIAEQRQRLIDALTQLRARTGADVRVIFDGADVGDPQHVATTARAVHVSFSPPDVEADDLILHQVGELPGHRPVVVATSDRRVQQEADRAGANVISSSQLLRVLR